MVLFLVVGALLAGLIGFFGSLAENRFDIGLIGLGCLLAMLGRLWQADKHHQELLARLGTPAASMSAGPTLEEARAKVGPSERARGATTEGVLGALGGR